MNEQEIVELIKSKRKAMEENLLLAEEVQEIKEALEKFLDKNLTGDNILALRYRKFKRTKAISLWRDTNGYPTEGFKYISPWIDFFEKYYAEKTIKQRIESENLWAESRTRGEELHLLIGEKEKGGEKVHLIIDETTGEIRVDKKDQSPENILKRVKAILTTQDGKKIQTTMEFLKGSE